LFCCGEPERRTAWFENLAADENPREESSETRREAKPENDRDWGKPLGPPEKKNKHQPSKSPTRGKKKRSGKHPPRKEKLGKTTAPLKPHPPRWPLIAPDGEKIQLRRKKISNSTTGVGKNGKKGSKQI